MAPSLTKSEHWLTLMCCSQCKQTPDESPIYICSLGHSLCLNCFKNLTHHGVPKCSTCKSTKFTAKMVSSDFLKKLKTRPGIGRPYRYGKVDQNQASSKNFSFSQDNMKTNDETVTIEKLFQMSTHELQRFFDETSRRRTKLTTLHAGANKSRMPPKPLTNNTSCVWSSHYSNLLKDESVPGTSSDLNRIQSFTSLQSRKPLRCPHNPCGKIIAMSSFQLHFKHEHTDIPKTSMDRGKTLTINLKSTNFEYNRTICINMVTIREENELSTITNPNGFNANIARKFPEKVVVGTYWLMMSGSRETKRTHAYMLFWLFTNETKEQSTNVNCTIEIASEHDEMAYSTFCSINILPDDLSANAIAKGLNCLYVTYGGIETLLSYGPNLLLRLTVH
ncbi:uncharacterized protein [Onthophagus taurus]|uniref:uncharacterized protein n=1 Tax=Onthophagus taurus TaxID=166361 RepID=UPI000C1FDE33|nr:uncharacterized protein LOC111427043 [Onthophagus taurus]